MPLGGCADPDDEWHSLDSTINRAHQHALRMPPLARSRIDTAYVELLARGSTSLEPAPQGLCRSAGWCDHRVVNRSSPVSVPLLQTRRLLLREYRVDDFEKFAAHLADQQATASVGSADRQTAWRIFGGHTGLWLLHGAGWWTVVLRETGEAVGTVGAFFREGSTTIEIGWNTFRPFSGRGYASEAAAEAVRYALEDRDEPRVCALIAAGNAPSIGVARRLDLRYDGQTELYGMVLGRYTRAREP